MSRITSSVVNLGWRRLPPENDVKTMVYVAAQKPTTRRGCHCLALSYIPRFNSSIVTFSLGTATRYLFMSAAGNQTGPGKSPGSMFMIFILPEKKRNIHIQTQRKQSEPD